ncbi:hypothetical protein HQ531_02405 [bacterium]|nr:hypothetical protein [bacterium]
MPNSTALVPGTGGITFVGTDGEDIGYPVKMQIGALSGGLLGKSAAELISLLSMEHRPGQIAPVKTSLSPGLSIRPGHTLKVAYNQVPDSWNQFHYDWRADIRYSAGQLVDFITERKPTNGRWNLVAHSQGGLVIVAASKMMSSPDEFEEYVASVILVGTPLAGTVNSARALILGEQLGKASAPEFQQIVGTWPSIYQMMPAWPAVIDANGNIASDDEQMTEFSAWNAYGHIDPDLIVRTKAVQKMLEDPIGWMMGDIEISILMAKNKYTRVRVQREDDGTFEPDILQKQMGDTLVPHDITQRWVGPHITPFVTTFTGQVNEHSRLFNDPGVVTQIKTLLR